MNNAYLSLWKGNSMFIKGAEIMILGRFIALYSETCLPRKFKKKRKVNLSCYLVYLIRQHINKIPGRYRTFLTDTHCFSIFSIFNYI